MGGARFTNGQTTREGECPNGPIVAITRKTISANSYYGNESPLLVHKSEVNSVERVPCLVDTLASMPLAHKIQVGGLL